MNRKTCLFALVIFFAISLSAYPANFIVNVGGPSGAETTRGSCRRRSMNA